MRNTKVAWLLALVAACLLVAAVSMGGHPGKQAPATVELDLNLAVHNVGELRLSVSNWGMFGSWPGSGFPFSHRPSAEWPTGSGIEYLYGGGIWISGRAWGSTSVSTAFFTREFGPPPDPIDVIYHTAEGGPGGNRAAHPQADDDGDGLVNEEWVDGRDNDGDGEVDEDYAGISDQMYARWYTDDLHVPTGHQPLHVTVREQSFQWAHDDYDDCVGFQYEIRNTGTDILDDVYIGIMLDPDAGPRAADNYHADDLVDIDTVSVDHGDAGVRDYDFVYGFDADGDNGATTGRFGVVFLDVATTAASPTPSHRVTSFAAFSGTANYENGGDPTNDLERFELMSSGIRRRPVMVPNDFRALMVIGPVQQFGPDDTITFATAAVATPDDGAFGNVKNAARLYFGEWFDVDGNPDTGIDGKEHQEHWFIPGDLPVRIPTVAVEPVRGGVRAQWTVDADVAIDGFQVVRREPGGEAEELVRGLLVPATRSFVDVTAKPGSAYEYAVWGYGVTGMPGRSDFAPASVPAGETALEQNQPNPFNPLTTIPFNLDARQRVELAVFDAAGRRVVTLLDLELDPGPHAVDWNGTTDTGQPVASGVYFYRMIAGGVEQTKKMMLLK